MRLQSAECGKQANSSDRGPRRRYPPATAGLAPNDNGIQAIRDNRCEWRTPSASLRVIDAGAAT